MHHNLTTGRDTAAPGAPQRPDPWCESTGRHGTGTAYRWDRCRCTAARRAVRKWDSPDGGARSVPAEQVRDAIRAVRDATGWTPQQFADRIGVHRATLSRITAGSTGQYVTRYVATAVAAVQRRECGRCTRCDRPAASARSPYCAEHRRAARASTYQRRDTHRNLTRATS